jgi:hypothetical protein
MHEILEFIVHIFWHHSIIDKTKVQKFKVIELKLIKLNIIKIKCKILQHSWIFVNTVLWPNTHRFNPCFWRKRYVSLRIFTENA